MTFTRARHNPLSLVILNERRFCASDGPRRAARTGVPHHARLWRDGVGDASRSLRGNTRAFGTLPYHPPAKLAPPRPLSEVEGTREESAFLPLLSMHPPATQKSATTLSPLCKKGAALGPRLLSIYLLIGYQLPPGEWDTLSNFILSIE